MKRGRRTFVLEDLVFDTVNVTIMVLIVVVTLYPFVNTLALSFNDALDSLRGGIYLFPREFTLYNYGQILSDGTIYSALVISILRTVLGVVTGVIASLCVSYPISRSDFVARWFVTKFVVFTMYFSGGIIPTFFLIRSLGLLNNFLVYIFPMMVFGFYILVLRTYIQSLPESIIESAKIEGASETRILFSIVTPLVKPALATIALYMAVRHWNSWFDTFLYASREQSLSTLQYELRKVLQSSMARVGQEANYGGVETAQTVTPTSVRATMTIVATAPVLVVYPFLQKHFVKGLVLGGVKG